VLTSSIATSGNHLLGLSNQFGYELTPICTRLRFSDQALRIEGSGEGAKVFWDKNGKRDKGKGLEKKP